MGSKGRRYTQAANFCFLLGICCLLAGIFLNLERAEIVAWAFGGVILAYGWVLRQNAKGKYLAVNKVFGVFAVVALLSFVAVEMMVFQAMKTDLPAECRYVMVLGAGLSGDGPSLSLKARLDAGLAVLKKYPDAKVIVSGGLGRESVYTEAEVMKRYLMERGVGEGRIIKEEQATRTDENMAFGKAAARECPGVQAGPVVIATSDYHMFRSKILARKYFEEVYGISAPSPWGTRICYAVREYFALIKMTLVDL